MNLLRFQRKLCVLPFILIFFGLLPSNPAWSQDGETADQNQVKNQVSEKESASVGLDDRINDAFKPISKFFSKTIFFEVLKFDVIDAETGEVVLDDDGNPKRSGTPFVLILLVFSAAFFTLMFGFVNITKFPTAIKVVFGRYDHLDKSDDADKGHHGEVSHFQALATAVSGTVGNGNIAGVALAIALGGPGATFWMIVCGLLGMSTKFVECTLGVHYRDVSQDGIVHGGPMYYLSRGLKERGLGWLGAIGAVVFSICCIGGSFGGGNAAQSNQATLAIKQLMNLTDDNTMAGTLIGIVMAILVAIVIIGGIKRIAAVTEKIVPLMAVMYVAACLYIIFSNFHLVGSAFGLIFNQAFTPQAGLGGMVGVLLVGFKRAAFSNEAGAGSASIAHSAVKTRYSASEGLVALLEPFIDTVVICTMTALVIIIFNTSTDAFAWGGDGSGKVMIDGAQYEGVGITQKAFAQYIVGSQYLLTVAVVLFAVSTMISWSYYGLQAWKYLFGRSQIADLVYKLLFCLFIVIGAAADMSSIWDFSDAMIFAMVFPNMIGLFILFPVVKKELARYLDAIRNNRT